MLSAIAFVAAWQGSRHKNCQGAARAAGWCRRGPCCLLAATTGGGVLGGSGTENWRASE